VTARRPRQTHGKTDQPVVPAPCLATDDSRLFLGILVAEGQVFEPVAQRLRKVARGDVFHGILRRHDLEPVGGVDHADVGHADDALVEGGQQHVLHRLGHTVELVDEEHRPIAHRLDERTGEERLRAIAAGEDERRVEPAGELALGVAVVAVDAHRRPAEVRADGEGHRGLADADRALEQKVTAGPEDGERRGELALPADDAVLVLDVAYRGHERDCIAARRGRLPDLWRFSPRTGAPTASGAPRRGGTGRCRP